MKTPLDFFLNFASAFCLFLPPATAQNIPDPNFAFAISLNCPACIDSGNNLTPAAQNLTYLSISDDNISNLAGIEGFINLKTLKCSGNQLNFLPPLPNTLQHLECIHNQLSSLPVLPDSLRYLYCSHNPLDSLPALPASLESLICDYNQLSSLPVLPDSLTYLYCAHNQLSSLPALPNGFVHLDCSDNSLNSLPSLPNTLKFLYCHRNLLSWLPALPDSLRHLLCSYNPMGSLPALPAGLTHVQVNNTSISCLPLLPDGLKSLWTSETQITCIPNQPSNPDFSMTPVLPLCSAPCDSSVSTSNILAIKPFNVQPNPVSEVLQVRFSADYEANVEFRLFNSNGQVVRDLSGRGDVELPVGDLPQGIYWLEVRGEGWSFREKILKK